MLCTKYNLECIEHWNMIITFTLKVFYTPWNSMFTDPLKDRQTDIVRYRAAIAAKNTKKSGLPSGSAGRTHFAQVDLILLFILIY